MPLAASSTATADRAHQADRARQAATAGAVAAGIAGVLIAIWAGAHGGPFGWELALDDALGPFRSGGVEAISEVLTQLGAGPILIPLLALACWATGSPGAAARPRTWLPVGLLAAGQAVESVLLAPFLRVGPDVAQMPLLSLGSGHTATAVLGWGLLAHRLRGTWLDTAARRARWTAPTLVALTRLMLGERWATDVLLGLAVGVVLLHLATTPLDQTAARKAPNTSSATLRSAWWRDSPWAWSVTGAAAVLCVVPALLAPRERWFGDLLVYAGSGGSAGLGQDVYAYRTMFGLPFTYPPFAAVLAEPLSRIPWPLLQALWCLATLAAAVGIARLVLRPVVDRIGLPLTVAALLVASPMRSHVRFGQVGVFLVLLVAVDLLGRRRPGLGLGLAVAIKLTPAVFLPWLAMVGARRRLRTTLLCAGGSTLAGLLLLWPSAPDYLLRALWDSSRFGANDIPGNQSVRGMLLRSGLPDDLVGPAWLAAGVVLAIVGLHNAHRLERVGNRLGAVAVLACLSVALSPISWVHHLVWLAFPIAALVAAGRTNLALAWWAVLVVSLPTLGWPVVSEAQGLTAVAAVLLLRRMLEPTDDAGSPSTSPASTPEASRSTETAEDVR